MPDRCLTTSEIDSLGSGEILPDARDRLISHLEGCASCQSAVENARKLEPQDAGSDVTIDTGAAGGGAGSDVTIDAPLRPAPAREEPVDPDATVAPAPRRAADGHVTLDARAAEIEDESAGPDDPTSVQHVPPDQAPVVSEGDAGADDVTVAIERTRGARRPTYPEIEGYTILGVLGQGGMGVVYRAIQKKLNRAVALKVLPSLVGSANPAAIERFRREATAAAKLHHTNIIPIYDFGESRDAYFYAMELIEGTPLDDLVKSVSGGATLAQIHAKMATLLKTDAMSAQSEPSEEQPLAGSDDKTLDMSGPPPEHEVLDAPAPSPDKKMPRGSKYFRQIARWMSDAALALDYAHEEGIIHRDIKPANLILSMDGRIMLADFGLAKSDTEQSVTMTGAVVGTLRYMSPEQAMARRVPVDHRTDLYSLGATLYEMLCLNPAVPGSDQKEILSAVVSRDPTPPRKLNPNVPEELQIICLKCLEKSADDRYDSGKDLSDDLLRFVNDLPIAARKPSIIRRTTKFVRRHKAPVAAAFALVLLSAAVVLWRVSARREYVARVERLQESAQTNRMLQQWEAAHDDLEAALRLDPDNIETLVTAAWFKIEQYKEAQDFSTSEAESAHREAIRLCKRVLAREPNDIRALGYMGIAQRRLQMYGEAIKTLERALEIDPAAFHNWSNLGSLNVIVGNLERAEECLVRGAEQGGTQKDPWRAAVWRNLAAFQMFRGSSEAEASLSTAIACDSTSVLGWVHRARMNVWSDDIGTVRTALDDAKFADRTGAGTDPLAKRYLAIAHMRLGELDQATTAAAAAESLGDTDGIASLLRAAVAGAAGRTDEAATLLAAADADRPAALREPNGYSGNAPTGDLWIETADEWLRLAQIARGEAPGVIAGS